ncbi:unnamed protein product [Coffea canephora]|uniref:Uncharacterized protein n=1 Tax=Coffea canephora TaxID=49390 RepID=A0A068VFA0_COFCA|nr:unnamed protein product [Coffea canephora]
MGFFRSCFKYMAGGVIGVYIAQNYDVPNLRKLASCGFLMAKKVEQTYRKPQQQQSKKKMDDDAGPDGPQNKI